MKEVPGNHTPSPDDLKALQASIAVLTERGAVRGEARELLKVLEKDNTWGLPKDQVKASIRALGNFMQRPAIFQEDIEDLTKVFRQEEKFARIDWAKKKEAIGERFKKAKDVTLRVAAAALGIGSLYLIGNGVTAWNEANNTPEAIAQRAADDQQKQETIRVKQEQTRREQLQVENIRTLGLTPSAISEKGFRIHYNPIDRNVKYVEVGGELGFFSINKDYMINWTQKKNDKETTIVETNVYISTYTRVSDGKKVPKLVSRISGYSNSGAIDDSWYLRDQPTEEIDTSVVVFEDVKNQKEYLFAISSPDNVGYQFRLMKKVPVANQ